ncbi:HAD family hydrolase [Streptomyces sp. NPDC040724]|uniref:HAD family hydrolase n=1 Tax=unclassified Streptomyces TaxID=2593676 RepID=UPI0033F04F89
MRHELVIFDNSGVLADSEGPANRVLALELTAAGFPTTFDEAVERYLGTSFADLASLITRRTGRELPAGFQARCHERLMGEFARELTAVPGVEETLDHLDALTVPYCVASNDSSDRLAVSLGRTGLAARTRGRTFGSDLVPRPKPAPDLFLHAAQHFGVDPAACLVIEDSEIGVRAARAAGMTVYGFAALTPPSRLGEAHRVFTSMAELRELITALFPAPLQGTRR